MSSCTESKPHPLRKMSKKQRLEKDDATLS